VRKLRGIEPVFFSLIKYIVLKPEAKTDVPGASLAQKNDHL
jgi:hypothetical protein